jgi:hypothetical protein
LERQLSVIMAAAGLREIQPRAFSCLRWKRTAEVLFQAKRLHQDKEVDGGLGRAIVIGMARDPEIVAEEIAGSVGGWIEFYEDPDTGECRVTIETGHSGDTTGYGRDRRSAFESLLRAAEEGGWDPSEPR